MSNSWWRKKEAVATAGEAPAVSEPGNGAEKRAPNVYLDARRSWNSQVDRAYSSQHTWQLMGIMGLLIGLAGVAGIAYVGSKSKFVPYVIEVDKLGEAVSVGPAQVATIGRYRFSELARLATGPARFPDANLCLFPICAVAFPKMKTKRPFFIRPTSARCGMVPSSFSMQIRAGKARCREPLLLYHLNVRHLPTLVG
jgi:hypothetical protein